MTTGYYAAAPDRLSRAPIDDGHEITREQYLAALDALSDPDDPRMIVFEGEEFGLAEPPEPEPEPEPDPVPPTEADLIAYAADKRFRVETGGIVVNGAALWTDRTTQAMLSRTVQLLDKGMLTAPINVKTPGGFVSLTQQQIEGIGAAVAQHVQASFDAELMVLAGIESDAITTTQQIDAAAWPPND